MAPEREVDEPTRSGAQRSGLFREQVLRRYESALRELDSPVLAADELRREIERQAEFVVGDCLDSIHGGAVVVDDEHLGSVARLGVKGVALGVRFADLLAAGAALTTVLAELLITAVGERAGALHALHRGLGALNQSVSARMRVLADLYEAAQQDRIREARSAELRRLSRDVHDWLGSGISLAGRQLDLYEVYRERGVPEAVDQFVRARRSLHEVLDGTRRLVADLRLCSQLPSLSDALWEFTRSMRDSRTRVELRVNGDQTLVPQECCSELFVVIRECLRNVFSHAGATRVTVFVDISPGRVRAVVEDDGTGFDPAAARDGHGLTSMRERMAGLPGGALQITTRAGRGTRVELSARLPGGIRVH